MKTRFRRLADLNRRLVVSIITIFFVFWLIAFSSQVWVSVLLVLTVAALSGVGVWEYAQLAIAKDLKPAVRLMILLGFVEVIAFFIAHKFSSFSLLPLLILLLGVLLFFLFHFKYKTNALINIAVESFGVAYVSIPLCFMLALLYPVTGHVLPQDGRWWLGYLIIVTKITDVSAYFVGKLWGRHRLAPVLSPKKTVEGAVAGFLCAAITSVLLSYVGLHFSRGVFQLGLFDAIWLGMTLGVLGQLGDLAESLLKRDAFVKDSNTLPGIGGVLDMLDSLLFTGPMIYLFLKMQ